MSTLEHKSDQDLLHSFLLGHKDAFGILIERYQKPLYHLCLRLCENHEDSLEIVQQTFVRVIEKLDQFQKRSSFKTWLYKIAINLCHNLLRQRSIHNRAITSLIPEDSGYLNAQMEEETKEIIRTSLKNLPEKQRLVVVLHVYHNLSYKEICQILNCQEVTVRSHFHLALKKLAEDLKGLAIEEFVQK